MKKYKSLLIIFFLFFTLNIHGLEFIDKNKGKYYDIISDNQYLYILESSDNTEEVILKSYNNHKEINKLSIKAAKNKLLKAFIINLDNFYLVLQEDNNFTLVVIDKLKLKELYRISSPGYINSYTTIKNNNILLVGGKNKGFFVKFNPDKREFYDLHNEVLDSTFKSGLSINGEDLLLVGEDKNEKTSLLVKYDKNNNEIISLRWGPRYLNKINLGKNNSYYLVGSSEYGGIFANYNINDGVNFILNRTILPEEVDIIDYYQIKDIYYLISYNYDSKSTQVKAYKLLNNRLKLINHRDIKTKANIHSIYNNNLLYIVSDNKAYSLNLELKIIKESVINSPKTKKVLKYNGQVYLLSDKRITKINFNNIINYNWKYIIKILIALTIIIILVYLNFDRLENKLYFQKHKKQKKVLSSKNKHLNIKDHKKLHKENKNRVTKDLKSGKTNNRKKVSKTNGKNKKNRKRIKK